LGREARERHHGVYVGWKEVMANIYQPEEKLLVLDLATTEGRIAAKTYAYVLLAVKDIEARKMAELILKELDQWDK
jgi:hypothetical protein